MRRHRQRQRQRQGRKGREHECEWKRSRVGLIRADDYQDYQAKRLVVGASWLRLKRYHLE